MNKLLKMALTALFVSLLVSNVEAGTSITVKPSELKDPNLINRLLKATSGGLTQLTPPAPSPNPPPPLKPVRQAKVRAKAALVRFETSSTGSITVTLKSTCEKYFDTDVYDHRPDPTATMSSAPTDICDMEVLGLPGKLKMFSAVQISSEDRYGDGQIADYKSANPTFYWTADDTTSTEFKWGFGSFITRDINQKNILFTISDYKPASAKPGEASELIFILGEVED